jgi:hypothetical protein
MSAKDCKCLFKKKLYVCRPILSHMHAGNICISSSSSSSSGHEVSPINDLFRTHDFIRLVISIEVVRVFAFLWVNRSMGI